MWVRAVETAVFAVRTTRAQVLAAICYNKAVNGTNTYPGLPKYFLTNLVKHAWQKVKRAHSDDDHYKASATCAAIVAKMKYIARVYFLNSI